jgi:hypothetical protein
MAAPVLGPRTKTAIPRGEETWVMGLSGKAVGTLWQGLYQAEITPFWKHKAMSFGPDEWERVRREATWIEAVKGERLLREISVADAERTGSWVDTERGRRWLVPLDAWTAYPLRGKKDE